MPQNSAPASLVFDHVLHRIPWLREDTWGFYVPVQVSADNFSPGEMKAQGLHSGDQTLGTSQAAEKEEGCKTGKREIAEVDNRSTVYRLQDIPFYSSLIRYHLANSSGHHFIKTTANKGAFTGEQTEFIFILFYFPQRAQGS